MSYRAEQQLVKEILRARKRYRYSDEGFIADKGTDVLSGYDIVKTKTVRTTLAWRLTVPFFWVWLLISIVLFLPVHWVIYGKQPSVRSWHYRLSNIWAKKVGLAS